MKVVERSLDIKEDLRLYLSVDDLRRLEEMISQTMQEHKAELEALPLHMLMEECAKDIKEFA